MKLQVVLIVIAIEIESLSSDFEKIAEVRQQIRNLQRKPHIITASWIRDCIDSKRIIAEGPYEPE